ncbi:MAG: SPOR domain-containing protein [Pseudomonadales bacterium]
MQKLLTLGDSPQEIARNLPSAASDLASIDQAREPVIDFYTRLREIEVMVPDDELILDSPNLIYLLQAGSFRNAKDADSLRAQLILLNLNAEVSKFNHNGEVWHRVIVGPFENHSAMSSARTSLLENGIESLLLTKEKS